MALSALDQRAISVFSVISADHHQIGFVADLFYYRSVAGAKENIRRQHRSL